MLQQVKCGQSKFKSINQNMSKTKNKSNEIHHKTPFAPKKTQICAVPNPENPRNLAPARGFRGVEENCEGWKGIRESSSLVSASGRGSKRFQRTIERGAKMVI